MTPIDRAILESCAKDFRRLKDLRADIPGGTLYRHAKRLIGIGWLERQGPLYRTTNTGRRNLLEHQEGRWNQLEQLYPPLALIPTEVHRAMVELILAAVMARQNPTRNDRHPFFVCSGDTLHWKTSLGEFVCLAFGLDPANHIVDCGSESGKSLFIRRTASGDIASQRHLLDASFVVLDEFLSADRAVRSSLNPFLAGKVSVPFENEKVTVRPVPLLTLNPTSKPTLEGQLGLSAPLIRRAIIANINAVVMPDLAASGGRAVSEARSRGPITIQPPTFNCNERHRTIVDLLKAILKPEAHERIDVEVVVNLCTGMTAMLADPTASIAQVVQRIGLLSETVGWVRPGWGETVSQFARHQPCPIPAIHADAPLPLSGAREQGESTEGIISLQVSPGRRESGLPSLHLSEELRATLTWLAVETGRPLEEIVTMLIQHFRRWQQRPDTMASLHRSLVLSQQLKVSGIDPSTLEHYLQARVNLRRYGRTFEDVPEALRLIARLARLPEPWDWVQAEQAILSVGLFIAAGIDPGDIEALLLVHERLNELGFDARAAEALAEALVRAGAVGRRRSRVLVALITVAGRHVDIYEAGEEHKRVQQDVVRLEARRHHLSEEVEGLKASLTGLQQEKRDLRARLAHMEIEAATCQSRFEVLAAFESFLRVNVQVIDASGELLDRVRALASKGPQPGGGESLALATDLHEKILQVLAHHSANAGRAA